MATASSDDEPDYMSEEFLNSWCRIYFFNIYCYLCYLMNNNMSFLLLVLKMLDQDLFSSKVLKDNFN